MSYFPPLSLLKAQTPIRTLACHMVLLVAHAAVASAQSPAPAAMPDFAALEAAGATIGQIRVNAIAPGYIMTEMTEAYLTSAASEDTRKRIPMRRVGDPSDLDGALLLLASKRASAFMTGSTITVDGGHLTAFW